VERVVVDTEVIRLGLVDSYILDRLPRDRPGDMECSAHRSAGEGEGGSVIRADNREVVAALADCHGDWVGAGAVGKHACVGPGEWFDEGAADRAVVGGESASGRVVYVPPVIPVPSEEIVAVPVDVPVPREPASVNVNESWVSFEIVAWTESSPNEPLSHSPPNAVNAPGDPWMRMTLDLSATTVAPVCVKFVSTNTLLVGFTAECATTCH
jgi:hypothetical protein